MHYRPHEHGWGQERGEEAVSAGSRRLGCGLGVDAGRSWRGDEGKKAESAVPGLVSVAALWEARPGSESERRISERIKYSMVDY